MVSNQEGRQLELAERLAEVAHTLAHSIRTVPRPLDSYRMLAELAAAQRSLAATYSQLVAWHSHVIDGVDYDGEAKSSDESALEEAHGHLVVAQLHAHGADGALRAAHDASHRIRWHDAPHSGAA